MDLKQFAEDNARREFPTALTHLIPPDEEPIRCDRHRPELSTYRALCGRVVESRLHQQSGDPTCPDCKRIDDEETAELKRMGVI